MIAAIAAIVLDPLAGAAAAKKRTKGERNLLKIYHSGRGYSVKVVFMVMAIELVWRHIIHLI